MHPDGSRAARLSVGSPELVGLRFCKDDVSLLLEVEFHGAGFSGRGFVRKTVSHLPGLNSVEVIELQFTHAAQNGIYEDVQQALTRRCSDFELPPMPKLHPPR